MGLLMFFQVSVLGFLRYIPRSGIAGSKDRSIFNFWGISILLSTVVKSVCIPTTSAKGFPFLRILRSVFSKYHCLFYIVLQWVRIGSKETSHKTVAFVPSKGDVGLQKTGRGNLEEMNIIIVSWGLRVEELRLMKGPWLGQLVDSGTVSWTVKQRRSCSTEVWGAGTRERIGWVQF